MDPPETSDTSHGTAETVTGFSTFQRNRGRASRIRRRDDTSPSLGDIYQIPEVVNVPELTGVPGVHESLSTPLSVTPSGLTPMTGMSSELSNASSQALGTGYEGGVPSGEELTDTEFDTALDVIWAVNHITNRTIKDALNERVRRHLDQALLLNGQGQPSAHEYKQMAQNLAVSEAVRYTEKRRNRGRGTVSVSSSNNESSRPPTPNRNEARHQVVMLTPLRENTSGAEIVPPSRGTPTRRADRSEPTNSTSQESGHRPPFVRPPPANWKERVEAQRDRNHALLLGEDTDIPDQGVTFIDGYPYDARAMQDNSEVKQEADSPTNPQGSGMTGIQLSLPRSELPIEYRLTTPLAQTHYPGRLNPRSDPLLGIQATGARTRFVEPNESLPHAAPNNRRPHQDQRRKAMNGNTPMRGLARESDHVRMDRIIEPQAYPPEYRAPRGYSMPVMAQPPTISVGKRDLDQHYRETMVGRLMRTITDTLGRSVKFPEGYKANLKYDGAIKYNGSPKFGDLERWLANVVNRYTLLNFGGDSPDTDYIRILTLAEYLEGDAANWFTSHVLSVRRTTVSWTFCDVIVGLYDRYILPSSMQDARENFRKVKYTPTLGVQGFYDALLEHAQDMAVYPDSYTILEEFMAGLPQTTLSRCFREHRLTVEANSLDEWVGAAKEIEQCDRAEGYYKTRSKVSSSTPTSKQPPRAPAANVMITSATNTPAPNPPNKGNPRTGWKPRRGFTTPRGQVKGREPYRRPADVEKRETAKPSGDTARRCYNCNGTGHFRDQCPQPKRQREYVRAAHTVAGETEDADDEGEGREDDSELDARESESMVDQGEHDDQDDIIEVPAGDFYEGNEADPDFMGSIYAFPLGNILGKASTPQQASTKPMGSAELPKKEATNVPAHLSGKRYRLHHTGKTRLRPETPPEDKWCLATWVIIGGLKAWTLWDTGSTTTGITPTFAELAKVKVDTLEDPHVLQLGTVGSRSIIKYGADVIVEVANRRIPTYVDIANFDRYEMIVGLPWMRQNRVVLDMINDLIILDGTSIPAIKSMGQDLDPRLRRHRVTDKKHSE
jgi:hypothetical protein